MNAASTVKVVRCHLAGRQFVLETRWVESIAKIEALIPNPRGDGPVGWLPTPQGNLPLYSLAQRLHIPEPPEASAATAVIIRGPQPWALKLDRVSRGTDIESTHVFPLLASVVTNTSKSFTAAVRLDDDFMLLLDPRLLCPEDVAAPPTEEFPLIEEMVLVAHREQEARAKAATAQRHRTEGRIITFATARADHNNKPIVFGLSVSQVAEILNPVPIEALPNVPSWVLGMIQWRNRPVLMFNLAERLGLESLPTPALSRMMIARGHEEGAMVGFLVNPVVRTLGLPIEGAQTIPPIPTLKTLLRGAVELPDRTLIFPDVHALLNQSN
jgi:chemotaxis signal transduction protein